MRWASQRTLQNELIATMSPPNRLRVKLAPLLLALAVVAGRAEETPPRFRAMYEDAVVFETALSAESALPPAGHRVTGITVPHHLVAVDLIARGFRCA
jgi:hypothetical protein